MTTNKPEIVAWRWRKPIVNEQGETVGATDWIPSESPGFLPWWQHEPLIRLSDYAALHTECEKLRKDAERYRHILEEPVGYVSPRRLDALRSGKACDITMEDKPDARNGVTIPLYTAECGCCGQTDRCDDDCDAVVIGGHRTAEQQPAPAMQEETLADRMRAAGMMTIDEVMNKAPHDGYIRHAGVHDLDSYGQWLDMKCRKFLTMQAKRELNKDPEDDMYEWVIAHAAVFQEARINFNAARHAKTEQQPTDAVQVEPVAYLRKDQLRHMQRMGPTLGEIADSPRADRVPVYTGPSTEQVERWRHDSEDLEALHNNLDDAGTPRHDSSGTEYSEWGRVIQYAKAAAQPSEQQPAPEVAMLVEALEKARDAIASLPQDALGNVPDTQQCQGWHIRDELINEISTALAAHRNQGGDA